MRKQILILFMGVILVYGRGAISRADDEKVTKPAKAAPPAKEKKGKVVTTPSGLKYEDVKVGTGPEATAGKRVIVQYTGRLADGKKFDSSFDHKEPFEFQVGKGEVIKGWDEGIAGMKEGGARKLIVPPELGYGARGAGGVIPPNATLLFDVFLTRVRRD